MGSAMKTMDFYKVFVFCFILICDDALPYLKCDEDMRKIFYEVKKNTNDNYIENIKKIISNEKNSIENRLKLVVYFSDKLFSQNYIQHNKIRQNQILWLIENCPNATFMGHFTMKLLPGFDDNIVTLARSLWIDVLGSKKSNVQTVKNTASSLFLVDQDFVEHLLLSKIIEYEEHSTIVARLISLYRMQYSLGMDKKEKASIYNKIENLYNKFKFNDDSQIIRVTVALTAMDIGELQNAKNHAKELMLASHSTKDYYFINTNIAKYYGNIILGLLASINGNIDSATEYLHRSIENTTPSPEISIFGLDFKLAAMLFSAGKKDDVIYYLEKSKSLWPEGKAILTDWINKIKKGLRPNFYNNSIDKPGRVHKNPGESSS